MFKHCPEPFDKVIAQQEKSLQSQISTVEQSTKAKLKY
jgi:hypothetical protein